MLRCTRQGDGFIRKGHEEADKDHSADYFHFRPGCVRRLVWQQSSEVGPMATLTTYGNIFLVVIPACK